MRSAHSMTQVWPPRAERCRPRTVLEPISPCLWSGFWRETDRPSPSGSPSAHPQPTFYTVRAPQDCHPPASLDSASSLRGPDSASAHWPLGFTMAPSSLLSAVARQSTSSARLPHPSGSALVWRRPSCTSGLHSSGFASSLRPSGSIRLLHPFGSSVICHSLYMIYIYLQQEKKHLLCSVSFHLFLKSAVHIYITGIHSWNIFDLVYR